MTRQDPRIFSLAGKILELLQFLTFLGFSR